MAAPAVAKCDTDPTVNPEAWAQALTLTCHLTLDMPLPGFRIADLIHLQSRSVVNTHWRVGADVPLRVNGKLIGRGEFEVVGDHLAVRLTELVGTNR